ncbi:hypothetical protein [Celerinatantimonas diazotrophica]|uniref:Lipoprotein SmpA/OmlA domain-containing protein n=1 Tax=Celerinatantimonas diazotrophica TaxID=412034 RepID=A0A4R1JAH7_9GAMM|nr:hypothetical protein [Celerinatantimonas diazotrophica]TCK47540.1 hypothetical protein EV690_2571 [Celerinatantimonas diazotrophica]CAG9296842.1 hypothetical protein CEDIAZO_02001 [Celerinatantimonas diazotrophica]
MINCKQKVALNWLKKRFTGDRFSKLGLILIISLSLSSCALYKVLSSATITDGKVSQIERGYTSEDDIVSMFGQPYIKTIMGNDWQRWTYRAAGEKPYSWVDVRMPAKTLVILFHEGVVRDYRYTTH